MGTRPIIGALGAPVLADLRRGLAQPRPSPPPKPRITRRPVGDLERRSAAAPQHDRSPRRRRHDPYQRSKTFWTTKWKGGSAVPHALPSPGTQVCGLG